MGEVVSKQLDFIPAKLNDKQINRGWSHPEVLQALASIRGIELYIWIKGENQLLPHLTPPGATEKKHLLFVSGNHFELLLEHTPPENLHQNSNSKLRGILMLYICKLNSSVQNLPVHQGINIFIKGR